jgi:hypothetical protein
MAMPAQKEDEESEAFRGSECRTRRMKRTIQSENDALGF